jgi:glycerophosphoryl diester phosphodiesterase
LNGRIETELMRPSVIAHRGASGHAYENSPSAFRRAVDLGADGVELDIHATSDGALLVHHDPVVSGVGPIGTLPQSAFAGYRLPNGEAIPTLGEALKLVDGLEVWVEVKTLPAAWDAALLAALDGGPTPERYAVHGFDHRIIARLGERRPRLPRGLLLASYLLDTGHALNGAGADTLWMEAHLLDAELVASVHEDGAELIGWTANEPAEIRRLVRLGVDGICGNYPDRIRAELR